MDDGHPKQVEDYTSVSLALILMNLLWIFGVIWTHWGLFPVILLGIALNHLIARVGVVRARRMVANTTRSTGMDIGDGSV